MDSLNFFIVTPSYNQGHFIKETIDSVLNQNLTVANEGGSLKIVLEYWVIDGGSTDNTLDILESYQKKHANFHYLSEKDEGQSDAINKGFKKAVEKKGTEKSERKCDIIAYINSDDCYVSGAFEEIAKNILVERKSGKEFMWYYGRSLIVDENGKLIQSFFSKVKNLLGKKYTYSKLLCFNIISQPAVFLKKTIVDEFGYFDKDFHLIMDYEYWLRIGKRYEGKPIAKALAKYRYYTNSKSGSQYVTQYFAEWKTAWKYSRKIVDFPFMVLHGVHFLLMIFWMKFTTK